MAKYAGQNVHKRLVTEDTYKEGDWEKALKRAFLGTDEDLLASKTFLEPLYFEAFIPCEDPAHTRDPSGCTAVAALITKDNKIYVVSPPNNFDLLSSPSTGKCW